MEPYFHGISLCGDLSVRIIKYCRPIVRQLSGTRVAQDSMEGQHLSALASVTDFTHQQALPTESACDMDTAALSRPSQARRELQIPAFQG